MGRPSRRQQTRLTFTPMPSSSPATKGYPQQIKERAAAVGYAGSSSKRRKLREADDAPFGADGANDMPTPAATMNIDHEKISSDEEEPVASNTRLTSRKRSRQQALDFSKVRDSSSFDSAVQLHSSPRTRTQRAGMFSATQSRRSRKAQKTIEISSGEEESEEEEQEDAEPAVSSRKLKSRSSQRPVLIDSDDEEEGDAVVTSSRPPATAPLVESDDEEEDMPTTQGRQPRRKRQWSRDSFISSSPPRAIESDSDLEIIEKPKSSKRGRRSRNSDEDNEEDEDDEVQPTPSRRKLSKRPRQMSQKEQEELNEDLDFLGPSSDVEALERRPRSTQDKQKIARQSALQKLKQKRSGLPEIIEVEDEEEEDAEDGADAQEDDDDVPEVTSSRKMFHAEEEDDAFIDSDPEGTLGVPDVQIPLAFTSQASAKPKELFKHAVEWFVQRKINPAFNMHDELYELTFRKLDDEVQGLAGSKFKSAAWTPAFYAAITARPEIAIDELDRHGEDWMNDKCDACNRSGHPATFSIQFQGKPYNPHTLENVGRKRDDDDDSSSSEEEEDDDQPTRDYRGNKVPPANIVYKVGKFCKANADTAHALQHWRHHLDSEAMLWMTKRGYLTDEKIIKRDGQSMKKRQKEANRITDHMETDGQIRKLWDAYRQTIDDARNSKQGRFAAGS
ncbi:hypothetical protein LTR27_007283 [Elasticomyces elasticus]|nr:hypothetical protein LTR27_007283 [Elasticomyces elasticus]